MCASVTGPPRALVLKLLWQLFRCHAEKQRWSGRRLGEGQRIILIDPCGGKLFFKR